MQLNDLPLFSQAKDGDTSNQQQIKPLSVFQLTSKIKGVLEPQFSEIWVQGEISNYRPAASGHLYFSLKDEQAAISAALFSFGSKKKLKFDLKDGLQVICKGKVSVYPPRGTYQLIVEHLEPLGAGALQLAFEQLKEKLKNEGLFDAQNKKKLPVFPKKIAVITSPSGAAIQDMLNILKRRAPQIEVLVVPAIVQGEEAPPQLVRALDVCNRLQLAELIVLARGGGSIEDLWCFNDETLARAISKSKLPVISAVGHEIDFTISDFVSDLRAPTPSAAAEILSENWVSMSRQIKNTWERLVFVMNRDLQNRNQILKLLSAKIVSPLDRIREKVQRCDELLMRINRAILQVIERRKLALGRLVGTLEALSPLKVLERGYSIVLASDSQKVFNSAASLKTNDAVRIKFHDGEAHASITSISNTDISKSNPSKKHI